MSSRDTTPREQGPLGTEEDFQPRLLDPAVAKRGRNRWWALIVFLFFSFLEIYVLSTQSLDFSKLGGWAIAGGAFFFPLLALITMLAIVFNWSNERTDRTIKWTFGLIILAPVILIIAVVGGYFLLSAFGWLTTIPSWAAVIIGLLLLIYFKK
jgi:hypothetical protein